MKRLHVLVVVGFFLALAAMASVAFAAYYHAGEKDAPIFVSKYPTKAGTKLDSCNLCHISGQYTDSKGNVVKLASCEWCHYKYGYQGTGDITATLNPYGQAYFDNGRSQDALTKIESLDSDGDGFTNVIEINALRFPGNKDDNPKLAVAPYRIFTKAQLKAMPQHKQFMLMNTTKSGDYYAEYSGVIVQDLLKKAGITAKATKITVIAADGYSTSHPIANDESSQPYVNGTYPSATYHYNIEADKKKTTYGWCNYSSAGNKGRNDGDAINVDGGLRLLLALQVDGADLVPGKIGSDFKLTKESEGPFRVVAPQKIEGPPDQASTAAKQDVVWPYTATADHNAGFSSKVATIIKVEPLPDNTTDIDTLEHCLPYVTEEKIIIYGNLERISLKYPADGARNVPWKQTFLSWTKAVDPDPAAEVKYTIEYSTTDPNGTDFNGEWTQISSLAKTERTFLAGAGKFMFFGIFGMIAVGRSRRSRKFLGIIALVAVTGAIVSSCGGDSPSNTVSMQLSQPLAANTTYYWRVTADGPSSHNVSAVSSFTTAP